jgi:hypothetical protein
MKRALLAVILVTGCSSSGGGGQKTESDFENEIASAIMFDPALLKAGDRVVYFVKRSGETETQKYSWAAVSEDRTGIWIENSRPWNAGRMIVKSKVDRSGKLLEQWVGEPGGIPGQTYPSPKSGETPRQVRDSGSAKADSKEEPDRIVLGGKSYTCTKVTTVLAYPDGRKSTMTNWFSKEVPFAFTSAHGGMLKRVFGRLSMELVTGDHGAKPEMQIPAPQK